MPAGPNPHEMSRNESTVLRARQSHDCHAPGTHRCHDCHAPLPYRSRTRATTGPQQSSTAAASAAYHGHHRSAPNPCQTRTSLRNRSSAWRRVRHGTGDAPGLPLPRAWSRRVRGAAPRRRPAGHHLSAGYEDSARPARRFKGRMKFYLLPKADSSILRALSGQVAQSVEQGSHKPRVGGSIPPLATPFPLFGARFWAGPIRVGPRARPWSRGRARFWSAAAGFAGRARSLQASAVDFWSRHGNVDVLRGHPLVFRVVFGDRLMAGQWSLEPFMKVRILLPEP